MSRRPDFQLQHQNNVLGIRQNNLLEDIKTNTASLNINTDTLEALQTTANTKLNGGLPSALTGSGNLKVCLQELGNEGSERLNVDVGSTVSQLPTALTGEGNLKVSIQEDFTHNLSTSAHQLTTHGKLDTIATNTANIKISTDSVNLNVDTLEALIGTSNSNLGSIKTAVELLDNAVSGSEFQVDVVAPLPAGTNKIGAVALKANESVDGSGTERHLVTDANGFLQVEDKAITVIAPNLNISDTTQNQRVNLALHDSGNSTTRTAKCNSSGEMKVEASGTVTANLSAVDNAVLDDIASKAGSIKTAVEVIDDIVKTEDLAHSSGDKGIMFLGVRQSSQADFGADGDYVPISINDDGEIRVTSSAVSGGATEAKQDIIETTLTNLETSLASLDNAVDGNYLNVNLNLAGSDVEGNSGNKSAATPRVVIATDDVNLSAIKTAVELLDNAVSGSEFQVDVVAALPSGDNNIGNVDIASSLPAGDNNIGNVDIASSLPAGNNAIGKLSANSGVDIGDVDVTSISAGTNRIGMVALKANENVGGTGTERHLICDSAGHLQVDVVSAPSTAVTGTVTANLSATDNAVLDAIDAVLDQIKIDTEAIETAVEALNTRDSLTTTLLVDGQTISGGATHTTSSFEVTNIPPDGKLKFLIRISGVSSGEISAEIKLSADDTNFFGADLGFITQGNAVTGVGKFFTCSFISKHFKFDLTNTNFSSTATVTVHMFN